MAGGREKSKAEVRGDHSVSGSPYLFVAMAPKKATAPGAEHAAEAVATPADKRPRVGEAQVMVASAKPKLDSFSSVVGARSVMKTVIPWVNQELLKLAGVVANQGLDQFTPLSLPKAEDTKSGTANYKEPWVAEHCAASCARAGMYEAGGSLFWVDPEVF